MIPVTFRPLGIWQGDETRRRTRSQFSAPWSSTLDLLDRELRQLNAKNVVVQIDVTESDIRLDGWPRASASPAHPGVVLSFESRYGPLRYATDRFLHWQENLRAVALGLEALRRVDRYGITKSGEQYTGWRQLTAGSGLTSKEEAARLIAELTNHDIVDIQQAVEFPDVLRPIWVRALKKAHPDHGGNADTFARIQDAGRLLGVR